MFLAGDWLASSLIDNGTDDAAFSEFLITLRESIYDLNLLDKMSYLFKGLIPYIFCIITNMVILYAVVTRVIRICVNATLSPIAASNFFDGTRHSDGVRL